ncbi:cysteine desulfurase family protein [Alterisphingorhabdus coralli]|uniref:Cysteine desulfurase n=1 Tax=Alterisphingorhabdus coralli TaxID=3071408 RepID=A0AA97I315_9SPHN|nr:cysteine desulfurase family protein [Parasphingorhabdus sp. SCSIO 66989]WOE76295.1 cysteine desulfurase family protein [Parasphingorhabdus sp. SCSIO 66989]
MADRIYLDYQATTPLAPEALEAMLPWLSEKHANPHSSHSAGREAAAMISLARDRVAALMPPGGQVLFTGGATEAINMAVHSVCGRDGRAAYSAIEHAAVIDAVHGHAAQAEHVALPVRDDGIVDLRQAEALISSGTRLVATMLINNEIGTIQPVAELADMAHQAGALMLCDAVQGYGRVDIPHNVDLVAISAHKIHGPKGIGALWVRDGVELSPLIFGGGQEQGVRSGTLSPALCVGFGVAAKLAAERREEDAAHVRRLAELAREQFSDWIINGSSEQRYPGNLNIRREGLDVARLISEVRSVAFSAGSACASGSGRPSHVLSALGLPREAITLSIRLGFGRYTSDDEIIRGAELINAAADAQ